MAKDIIVIGYSGHAFVVIDTFLSQEKNVIGYCEFEEKHFNPYSIRYYGNEREEETRKNFSGKEYFIAIGDNTIRRKIFDFLSPKLNFPVNAIHRDSTLSSKISLGSGILVAPRVVINSNSSLGDGVICNTGSIIEHDCKVGAFAHIGPSAVLCGNVQIGENSFVGANAVIKEGIKIGSNTVIGTGSVIIRDVPDNCKVVGNPSRQLS